MPDCCRVPSPGQAALSFDRRRRSKLRQVSDLSEDKMWQWTCLNSVEEMPNHAAIKASSTEHDHYVSRHSAASSTDADCRGLELLSSEFDNFKARADSFFQARK